MSEKARIEYTKENTVVVQVLLVCSQKLALRYREIPWKFYGLGQYPKRIQPNNLPQYYSAYYLQVWLDRMTQYQPL